MNKSVTLSSVYAISEKRSSILIDEAYADSFFRFLCDRAFKAIGPTEAINRTTRCYRDESGKIHFESEPTDMEIIVASSPSEIESVLEEWIVTIK